MNVLDLVARQEAFRDRPYRDTVGKWTVGYGRNLQDVGLSRAEMLALLQAVPLPPAIGRLMLENDVEAITHQVAGVVGDDVWPALDEVRRAALVSMGFMGPGKLAEFTHMIAAMRRSDWEGAAREALDSKWASQVGVRATEIAAMLRTGEWPAWARAETSS